MWLLLHGAVHKDACNNGEKEVIHCGQGGKEVLVIADVHLFVAKIFKRFFKNYGVFCGQFLLLFEMLMFN